MPKPTPAVYMETNRPNGTLYTGVTGHLRQRHQQHAGGTGSTFTRKYALRTLVWYKLFATMPEAIAYEDHLKDLPRARKVKLILAMNPTWQNLESHLQDL